VDGEKLHGKEGELWLLVLVDKGYFYQRLLNCLASRENSGVSGFRSVMVQLSSYLGSHGPGLGRAGRSLCYSHVQNTTSRLHFNSLFINSLILLNTILNGTKFFLSLDEFGLCTAYNTRNFTLLK
jgi:hypothetical protein